MPPLGNLRSNVFRTLYLDNTTYQTNSVVEEYLIGFLIPANTLGANGILHVDSSWNKTGVSAIGDPRIRLSYDDDITGTILQRVTWSATSLVGSFLLRIRNKNVTNSQHTGAALLSGGYGTSTGVEIVTAFDTTLDTYIVFSGSTNTLDTLILDHVSISLMKAA